MSFVFNNCSIGDGAQFITVEAGASLTLNLGGGYRTSTNTSTANTTRCPLKLAEYKAQLKSWAQRCTNTQAPQGFNTETWGGSPKVFDDGATPQGLNKGDTLFFWKEGVTNPNSEPIPKGFEAVYAKDGVLIVVPTPGDNNDTTPDTQNNHPNTPNADQADLDDDGEDELSGADASLEVPQGLDPWDDDDDEGGAMPTINHDDDDDGLSI